MKLKLMLIGLLMAVFFTGCSQDPEESLGAVDNPTAETGLRPEIVVDYQKIEAQFGPYVAQTLANLGLPGSPETADVQTRATGASPYFNPGVNMLYTDPDEIQIPTGGEKRKVVAVGVGFANFDVRAWDANNFVELDKRTVTTTIPMVELEVGPYLTEDAGSRVVMFQYEDINTGEWKLINYAIQLPTTGPSFMAKSTLSSYISADGASFIINFDGFPTKADEFIMFTATDDNNVSVGNAPSVYGTGKNSVTMTIGPNQTGAPRQVHISYFRSIDTEPTVFESWTQVAGDNGNGGGDTEPTVYVDNLPEYIPTAGGTYTLRYEPAGSDEAVQVRAYDITTGRLLSTEYVMLTPQVPTKNITIIANPYGYNIPVVFQKSSASDQTYTTFEAVAQLADESAIDKDDFDLITNIPVSVPAIGGSYTVTLNGTHSGDNVQLRVYDYDSQTIASTNSPLISSSNPTVTIHIGANPNSSTRNLMVQAQTKSSNGYKTFYSCQQLGTDSDNFVLTTNATALFPYKKVTYNVTMLNTFTGGAMRLRAYDNTNNVEISEGYAYIMNSNPYANITLKDNYLLTATNVTLQYSIDMGPWITFHSGTRERYPFSAPKITGTDLWLSNGRVYANGNTGADMMTWAVANGYDLSYNSTLIGAGATPTQNTGCNAYTEIPDGSDRGLWRVPTTDEWALIKKYAWQPEMGKLVYYWASNERNATQAYSFSYGLNIVTEAWPKSHDKYLRCVRLIEE